MFVNDNILINPSIGDVVIKNGAPQTSQAESNHAEKYPATVLQIMKASWKDEGLRQSAQEEKEESSFWCNPRLNNRFKEAGKQLGISMARSSAWISRSPPPSQPMQPSWEELVDKYDPGPPPRYAHPGTKFDQFNHDQFTLLWDD